jgi:predicted AlkP superfamily phosphohydrolase/phosphomutase
MVSRTSSPPRDSTPRIRPYSKVLVLGLDGATFDLLNPWMQQGLMPTLERLTREGAAGDLQSVVPPLSSSAWASFATGKNPGKHGLFDFVFPRPDSYELSIAGSGTCKSKTLWDILSENNKKVGIVGVPMTYPPPEVNGFLLSSFMTPGSHSNYSFPSSLKDELAARGLRYRPALRETHRSGNVEKFLAEVALSTRERFQTVLYLLQNKEWDLFCFVFLSPDLLQHELWRLLDATHPEHDPQEAAEHRNSIHDFYTQLDEYIAGLIEAAGDNTLVILVSDHGFGPATHFLHVNNWLLREGFLVRRSDPASALKYALFRLGFTPMNTFRALTSLRLGWLRQYVRFGRLYRQARRLYFSLNDIDWSKTRAFSVGNWGQIYINAKGQRPEGIVETGGDSEELEADIIARLLDLRDPNNSHQVVQQVIRGKTLYFGEHRSSGPDLVPMTRDLEYVAFGAMDFGSNCVIESAQGMSGHHRMNGILITSGKHTPTGSNLTDAKIIDVTPTILHAMGIPIPFDMDGRVLTEAFTTDFNEANTPSYSDAPSSKEAGSELYTKDDEERVRARLKGMGYLG